MSVRTCEQFTCNKCEDFWPTLRSFRETLSVGLMVRACRGGWKLRLLHQAIKKDVALAWMVSPNKLFLFNHKLSNLPT